MSGGQSQVFLKFFNFMEYKKAANARARESSANVSQRAEGGGGGGTSEPKVRRLNYYREDDGGGASGSGVNSGLGQVEVQGEPGRPPSVNEDGQGQSSSKDAEEQDQANVNRRNLIVNFLPQSFSHADLQALFSEFGPIESCRIMHDKNTGYSFGFGFVNFVSEGSAQGAIEALNGFQIDNKRIKVSLARPPSDDIKETNLYITNLPRDMTDEDVYNMFSPFGEIVHQNLLRDRLSNLPRGVAFVRYARRDQADAAISNMNNFVPNGAVESLVVKKAVDHGRQKATFIAGFRAGRNSNYNQPQNSPNNPRHSSNIPMAPNSYNYYH